MTPDAAYRTDLPPESPSEGRGSYVWPVTPPMTQATDNAAPSKVLLYGPKGEALIRQEPRRVGFREPR
jgi:hypothetical protein